ncbi:MAG: hypothetical protein ETSY1_10300 [Candidatus Entotheonella factor]|uniref:GTPase n=1 Tax=Entotheonella factor TaxID=1429438 RepID=W4LS18_ENTF1|nr:MAG: hypothetical protein ETSY1_10300 [Candidatus Entotheonella factor]
MNETQDKHAEASNIVKRHVYASIAAGLVPVVWFDMVALTALQLKMLRDLAQLYNVDFSNQLGQSAIAALVSGGAVYPIRMLAKYIPIAGWLATLGSVSLFSGASTYAVGKVFIQHFSSGGTFLTFDPQKVRDYYQQQFTQAKGEVKQSYAGVRP